MLVPQNRTKSKFKTKLYEQQPMGLYLGRLEKADSHLVLLEKGEIRQAHTVKGEPDMSIETQRIYIQEFDDAPKPNAVLQKVYNETAISPLFNPDHMVATRSVGSTARYNRLTGLQKQVKQEMFGPSSLRPVSEPTFEKKIDELKDVIMKKNDKKRIRESHLPEPNSPKNKKTSAIILR